MKRLLLKRGLSLLLVLTLLFTLWEPAVYADGEENPAILQGTEENISGDIPEPEEEIYHTGESIPDDDEILFAPEEYPALPAEAISEEISSPVLSPFDKDPAELCDDVIRGELPEKRGEEEKRFVLSDGSIASAIYAYAVHEKDGSGAYQEIDNRLAKKEEQGKTVYVRTGLHDTVRFPESPEDGFFYSIETDKGSIRWGLTGINEKTEAVFSPVSVPEGCSLLVPKSAGDHLRYPEVFPESHTDYRLIGHTLKEDLVLESPEALESSAGFMFCLTLSGYTAEQKDEKSISLLDGEGTEAYRLSAPVMTDAGGGVSEGLELLLMPEEEDGTYPVKLLPDTDWLLSEDRIYPVTIDPSLAYMIGGYGGIEAASVSSGSPDTTDCYNLAVGRGGTQGNIRALFKLNSLPALTESETVIHARVSFVAWFYSAWSNAHIGPVTVNLHPLTESLPISQATWNTLQGKYSGTVTDSETVAETDITDQNHPRVTWDITKTVKDWYLNNTNYGMAMISENESASSIRCIMLYSAIGSYDETILPVFTLTYLNQEGTEDYLTYHSSGSDTMGTLSVGDFNGNLIYTYDDLSMSGAYLPVSISHVYNASRKTESDVVNTHMHFGKGMRLNLSLRILSSSVNGYPYKLIDADGTTHYFSLKSGTPGETGSVYEKEFDKNTIITKTASGYTLSDGGTLSCSFNQYGYLIRIDDITSGKYQQLQYQDGRLTKVTDGGGRIASLSYNSSGYLTEIKDPANRSTAYTYDANGCLTGITRPDGTSVTLTYTAKGGGYLISKITDIDSTSIAVSYYGNAPYRVKQLLEYSSGNAQGRKLTFSYNPGETTVTDRQGRSETMLFDVSGHTVCIRDGEGNAVCGNYGNTDDNKKHALEYVSSVQGSVRNYLVNHGFENTPLTWGKYNSSNTAGSYSVDTGTVREGQKSLKIVSTGDTASHGVYETVSIPSLAGKMVTLSAYVYYEDYTPSGNGGFYLNIRYQDASGNWVNNYSSPMPYINGWHRISWTVTVPSDTASDSLQPSIVFFRQTGTCYIDSVQLEEGAVANRYNLLENGHIRDTAGTARPASWSGNSLEGSDQIITGGHDARGYRMYGNSQSVKTIYQNVYIRNGKAGDSYVFGTWAKSDSIPKLGLYKNNNRYFAVRVRFVKTDGTNDDHIFSFEAKTPNWQYLSGTATAAAAYTRIQFALFYNYQKNDVIFDDACLFRERYGDRYTYDSEGRVTKKTDQAGLSTTYTYVASGRPELSRVTYPDGTTADYSYHSANRRLLSITDSSGKAVSYTYDADGNRTAASTTVNGQTIKSDTSAFSGNYLSTLTDAFGNSTSYSYNQNKGTLASLTNARGVTTSYTYQADNDRLTKVQTGTSSVSYTYTGKNLTGLTHNTSSSSAGNVSYSFLYNSFGTATGTKAGTQSFVSYTYGANNGDLIKTQYGNGQYEEPSYDSLGRVTCLSWNNTPVYEYFYGTNVKVGLEKDLGTGISRRYEYDQAGRTVSITGSDGERHYYTYSGTTGELTKILVYNAQGTSIYGRNYTYGPYNGTSGERVLTEIGMHGSRVKVKYSYDDFYRPGMTVELNSGYTLNTAYTWRAGSGTNRTSLMPSGQTSVLKDPDHNEIASQVLSCTYDTLGNVSTVKEGGTLKQKYYYDDLNQLIRENNLYLNKTVTYSYDLGGNLLETKEYPYQTDDTVTGTPTVTNTYTYGDSNWKDKLTAYNGNPVTYDAIGNPLSYYNGFSFTWQKGRQLASASNGTDTVSYTYNSSGYRTSKTVNGVTSAYTLEGDKVFYERNGDTNLWYYYDANGAPVAMTMGNSQSLYLYRKDLQGDITGIYSGSTGALLVSYRYDAWGKVTAVNEAGTTEGTNLIAKNPYLYRGYRYDSEMGLYYLNSRYYDPETGRFINADAAENLGADEMLLGHNLFTYCLNNPVNRTDECGDWSLPNWGKILVGVAVVATIAVVTVATAGAATPAAAAAYCFAAGALQGAVIGAAAGTVTSAAMGAVDHRITTGSWEGAGQAAINASYDGFMMGTVSGAITGGIMSNVCFIAGTAVLTAQGAMLIEDIKARDIVLSWDEDTGEVREKAILETYVNEADELIHIYAAGEKITVTPGHPFYTPIKGWTRAVDLRAGDLLATVNGEYVIVEQIQHELLESPVKVYNISVEDCHTYYVTDSGVLVHNACGGETAATKYGREMHKAWDYGPDVVKEKGIPGAGRADGIDITHHIVYELKPDNPRAVQRGLKQLERYAAALSKSDGAIWKKVLVRYKFIDNIK